MRSAAGGGPPSTVRRRRSRIRPGSGDPDAGVLAVPGDRPLQPLAQRRPRAEAEELLRPRGVEEPARLPVRLRLVPEELAVEPGQLRDQRGEVADRDLVAGADVD